MRSRKALSISLGLTLGISFLVCLVGLSSAHADDWNQHEQRMMSYRAKIHAIESDIHGLIEHKHHAKKEAMHEILVALTAKHKDLQQVAKDHREEWLHMRFKHPDKGDLTERQYQRYVVQTFEEMESNMGLDGKLDVIKKKVQAQYQLEPKVLAKSGASGEHGRAPAAEEKKELTPLDKILLKK